MDFVDSNYIGQLSSHVQKFKKVKNNLYNFRCPICGDSQKNKNKARGYIYQVKNNANFKCHNCGSSLSLGNLLKKIDPQLHKQYVLEKFKEGHAGKSFVTKEPEFNFEKPAFEKKLSINLPKVSECAEPLGYIMARKLDPDKFYYTETFKAWINSIKPTFESTKYDEPRIIIPLIYNNTLVGVQGRSIKMNTANSVKYITIMFEDDAPKIYGLDDITTEDTVYVTEGPFDSTFIPNSIAMCGADADISKWGISNPVWIYDNEPRNREIVTRIQRTIDSGGRLVIWPENIDDKDINDMVMSGLDVQSVIKSNTYSGLEAKLKFTNWKKI
ncbi:MAG: DNA primase [Candidatus Neomarinimicrobiota bacterium]